MAHSVQLFACWVTLHAAVQKDPDFNLYIHSYLPFSVADPEGVCSN